MNTIGGSVRTQDFEFIAIEGEARRICDQRGWASMDEFRQVYAALRHQAFMNAIRPYIDMKCRVHNLTPPKRLLLADGLMQAEYEYSPVALDTLKLADDMIAIEANRFGYGMHALNPNLKGDD